MQTSLLTPREVYTFAPGPCILPYEIQKKAQDEFMNFRGLGVTVLEVLHRGKEYMAINQKCIDDLRSLLSVPDNFEILLTQGGATTQYSAVPMNILGDNNIANYLVTGFWGNQAYKESQKYCAPNLVAPIPETFNHLPNDSNDWKINDQGAYFYYCDNETVDGLEFKKTPEAGNQLLVADLTSSIATKPIDFAKHGLVYASAQKNLGCSGICFVIVRKDLIGKQKPYCPMMLSYQETLKENSILNTPPTFNVYIAGLTIDFLIRSGGLTHYSQEAQKKADIMYEVIDSGHGFYKNRVQLKEQRSRLNHVFYIKDNDQELQTKFVSEAAQIGLIDLKGHFSTGGIRANIYNAMPVEGVKKLRDFMIEFAEKNSQ